VPSAFTQAACYSLKRLAASAALLIELVLRVLADGTTHVDAHDMFDNVLTYFQ
jgi:hypothetical protein